MRNKNLFFFVAVFIGVVMVLKWRGYYNSENHLTEKLRLAEEKITSLEAQLNARRMADLNRKEESLALLGRTLGRELDSVSVRASMEQSVTVILYSFEESAECLKSRIDKIVKEYPNIKIHAISSSGYPNPTSHANVEYLPNIAKEGKALETATKNLKSKYVLYLSTGTEISPHVSDYSISWLFHALEKLPELDFVGGSFLNYAEGYKYPLFEVHCHRLRLCNWTLSQSYEYRYSVDDMMICEETSPSFMGRVSSLQKVPGQFDPNLDTMATADFFLRGKGKVIAGLRPEVRFTLPKICRLPAWSKTREADLKLELMKKFQLYIIRNSWGREVLASDSKNYDSLKYNIDHVSQSTYHNPLYIRGLLLNLETSKEFYESKNVSYFLDGGIPLGGYKMRGILPWDLDIDLGFFHPDWKMIRDDLKKHCEAKGIEATVSAGPWIEGMYEVSLRAGKFAYCDMYQHVVVDEDWFMYMPIHGKYYPVLKNLTAGLRELYGLHFLENRGGRTDVMKCKIQGHHACVPDEYAAGGGHWREFYCQS